MFHIFENEVYVWVVFLLLTQIITMKTCLKLNDFYSNKQQME